MICKPMIIKSKRSQSSFHNSFYHHKNHPKHYQSEFTANQWQNSLVSLNKVLCNLNDDTIKRYNTQVDQYTDNNHSMVGNQDTKTLKESLSKKNPQNRNSNKFQTLQPEPWFNDNEIRKSQKSSKTNHVLHSSHFSLPKDWQHRNSLQKSIRDSSCRDRLQKQIDAEKQRRISKITKLLEQNQALWTQNFNYTNEQKAKVSIQYLTHEQKHKKMQKILKYKRNLICKPGLQKHKVNEHSKYLVDMLKKLSKDCLFASNYVEQKNEPKKKKLIKPKTNPKKSQNQTIEPFSMEKNQTDKKFSSSINLASADNSTSQVHIVKKSSKPVCSIKKMEADFKIQNQSKQIHNYKMTFKPRKNFIFEKKVSSNSERNLNENEMGSMRKLSDKHFTATNHFLKVKRMKS